MGTEPRTYGHTPTPGGPLQVSRLHPALGIGQSDRHLSDLLMLKTRKNPKPKRQRFQMTAN